MQTQDGLIGEVAAFLDALKARNSSPATVEHRRQALRRFMAFMAKHGVPRFQNVTLALLEDYRRDMFDAGLSENTVEQYLRAVRLLLKFLGERGALFENPAERMTLHRRSQILPRVPSQDDVERLLAQPNTATRCGLRDRALLELLYGTGVRVGEAIGLDMADLDLHGGTVRVLGKGRVERALPLGDACLRWLTRYLENARPALLDGSAENPAVWVSSKGRRLGRAVVEGIMHRYSRRAPIEPRISPHALRRAMATHMLRNGASPLAIQKLLGHASLQHLRCYLRLTVEDLKAMHRRSRPGR